MGTMSQPRQAPEPQQVDPPQPCTPASLQAEPEQVDLAVTQPAPEPWEPTDAPDQICAQAVEQARAALVEEVDPSRVGEHLAVSADGPRVVSHHFACTDFSYQGWYWSVTLARAPQAQHCTVSEVVLLPGEQALRPPQWLPWSQRLRPGDVGVGDLLPTAEDDYRLVPGYFPLDDTGTDACDDGQLEDLDSWQRQVALEQEIPTSMAWQLGLGKARVLSPLGRIEVTTRWYEGEAGPHAAVAQLAPAQCSTCGFFLPLAGGLRQAFGVCANEYAPNEGRVVSVDHGCGAHSEVAVIPKSHTADLVVDQLTFDQFDLHSDQPAEEMFESASDCESGVESVQDAADAQRESLRSRQTQ